MKRSSSVPEVNAGSMADIAFLLLLFFLVTSAIPNDNGINRKLPGECPPNVDCTTPIPDRNIMLIAINNSNEIMVNQDIIDPSELKEAIKMFLDNNGDGSCNYCQGEKSADLSDNPKEAILSLKTSKLTTYNKFIEVQDEISKAYYELRSNYSQNVLKKSEAELSLEDIKKLRDVYPFILSEAEIK